MADMVGVRRLRTIVNNIGGDIGPVYEHHLAEIDLRKPPLLAGLVLEKREDIVLDIRQAMASKELAGLLPGSRRCVIYIEKGFVRGVFEAFDHPQFGLQRHERAFP